jgi:hypothetical protein
MAKHVINECQSDTEAFNQRNKTVSQKIDREKTEAEKDQDRVTRPLYPEEVPLFMRDSTDGQSVGPQDEKDKSAD